MSVFTVASQLGRWFILEERIRKRERAIGTFPVALCAYTMNQVGVGLFDLKRDYKRYL